MNVLLVGAGKGSWTIRGQQLGAAIGARVTSAPSEADWRWAEVAILVKRAGAGWAPQAHRHGVPIVWDALDFWRQPADNGCDARRAGALLQAQIAQIRPTLVLGATTAMATAAGGRVLAHHTRAGLTPAPARPDVHTVAYEGHPGYLGVWHARLTQACQARGWTLVINPPDLRAADLVVAFRDGPFDGWICREWKSGVKLTNALAAGRPVIGQPSAAWRDLPVPGTPVETAGALAAAFDAWTPRAARTAAVAVATAMAPAYTCAAIATAYQALLTAVLKESPVCGA